VVPSRVSYSLVFSSSWYSASLSGEHATHATGMARSRCLSFPTSLS
jgi:hypothetical protein